jgi:hypothetical protein
VGSETIDLGATREDTDRHARIDEEADDGAPDHPDLPSGGRDYLVGQRSMMEARTYPIGAGQAGRFSQVQAAQSRLICAFRLGAARTGPLMPR